MNFDQIDIHRAKAMVEEGTATFIDIRDPGSYAAGHLPGALHVISPEDAERVATETPKDRPLVVYCYHGISSQNAAAYFAEQGFGEVYSMIGGFEDWRLTYPASQDE